MNRKIVYIISAIAAAGYMVSCSTTKRLAEGEILYTGVRRMRIESTGEEKVPGGVTSAVRSPLSVRPNNPLFSPYVRTPLPTGLWVWNYLYTERERGLRSWIYRRLGKQPVLISQVQPETRVMLVEQILDNHGYFGSTADYQLHVQRNPRKNRISYHVRIAEPWSYSRISYPAVTDEVTAIISEMKQNSALVPGKRFDIDTLIAERIRITNRLRNSGYYYFTPGFLEYQADTTQERLKVDLRMIMAPDITPEALMPRYTGDINLRFYNPTGGEPDSLYLDGIKVWYQRPLRIRPKVLGCSLRIKPGKLSRVRDINASLDNLTRLGIFRYVNMTVTPLSQLDGTDTPIDMTVTAAFDEPIEAEFEVDFSSKSNSFIGPGAVFSVSHKNIFRGGEVLSVRLNGAYEWQTGNRSAGANLATINSYEFGINTSLAFPRLLVPWRTGCYGRFPSRTTIQLGAVVLNRPRFFTMASFNGSLSYDFQTSRHSFHNLTLLRTSYNRLIRTTQEFDSIMSVTPTLRLSFENQFIPAASYTYTFDRSFGKNMRNRIVWQTTFTTAGNILAGIYILLGPSGTKRILGNPFSQFIKGTTEIRYFRDIGKNTVLASRLLVGAGHAYGNSEVLPYSEQFFIGGAYSIRAFAIRSLGPGSFRPEQGALFGFFDQTGDFKLEANVELRMRIAGRLNGAVFLDAGNIWLLEKDESRPGGKLTAKNFWNEVALGTGVGLRYDLTFIVIRADLGIALHTPYKNPDRGGYYNISSFKDGLSFHLAIGYPF